jgi:hypothetical protein
LLAIAYSINLKPRGSFAKCAAAGIFRKQVASDSLMTTAFAEQTNAYISSMPRATWCRLTE